MPNPKSRAVDHFRRAVLFGTLSWSSFISLGCSTWPQALSRKTFDVFAGFTFVGTAPYDPKLAAPSGASEVLPKHGTAEQHLPDRLQLGIQYVFHHRRPVDNEQLALVDFPARLRAAGITVVKAPKSTNDLMYLFLGGPLFHIQISDGGHTGVIYDRVDPDLVQASGPDLQWTEEDYVLLWLK